MPSQRISAMSELGGLTGSEASLVAELRAALGPALQGSKLDTDLNLRRWLAGLDYDLPLTAAKLRAHLRHRSAMDLDNILSAEQDEDFAFNSKYWPTVSCPPRDESTGATLFVDFLGAVDTPGIIRTTGIAENTVTRTFAYETMLDEVLRLEERTGKPASAIYVVDLTDMSLSKDMLAMATGPCKCLAYYLQENWVELMGTILVVNCPTFWLYLWALVKPLLPERTQRKILTLGPDWRKQITNFVPPANLPVFYGGEIHVPRPTFLKVPLELYWKDDGSALGWEERELSVKAGKAAAFTVRVAEGEELDSLTFRYLLSTESKLQVLFSERDSVGPGEADELELVGPSYTRHYGANYHPNKIRVRSPRPGFYHLHVVNAYSWWSPLKLRAAVVRA